MAICTDAFTIILFGNFNGNIFNLSGWSLTFGGDGGVNLQVFNWR